MSARILEIVPYQAHWPHEFHEIASDLKAGLKDFALRIDHIGSTSVPGLGAKDVIDVQVTVASLFPDTELFAAFQAAGSYRLRGDLAKDHRPFGDEKPRLEWQKRYAREPEGKKRTHIHVRVAGAANQRYALLFRDFLRNSAQAAANYEKIKRELARLHPHDIDAYLAVKDPVCDLIMMSAEEWAKNTGWELPPTDA